jgi:hypothetical protein
VWYVKGMGRGGTGGVKRVVDCLGSWAGLGVTGWEGGGGWCEGCVLCLRIACGRVVTLFCEMVFLLFYTVVWEQFPVTDFTCHSDLSVN